MGCRNVSTIPNLMFTDTKQSISGPKIFEHIEEIFTLRHWEAPITNFVGQISNWNNGIVPGINGELTGIINGFCFNWYENKWVFGLVRGGDKSDAGIGIGKLTDDGQIIPVLRINTDGLYFMEKKITLPSE